MLIIPTLAAENSYIPLPGTISHSILGLFILEDWQSDLHPQTSSSPSCSVALCRPSSHGQLMGTLFTSPIWTPSPWRWRSTGKGLSVIMGCPSSMPSSTPTDMLRMSVHPLSPLITHFIISHHHSGSIFLQASNPLFNVVCCYGGLFCPHHSLGATWLPWP